MTGLSSSSVAVRDVANPGPGPRDRRAIVTTLMLLAGPLVLLVGTILHPPHGGLGSPSWLAQQWLGAAVRGPARFYVSHVVLLAGLGLIVPALLWLADAAAVHTPGLAMAGRFLSLAGAIGTGSLGGVDLVVWRMGQSSHAPEMASLMRDMTGSPGLMGPVVLLTTALGVGLAVLVVALRRAGIVSLRSSAVSVVGVAVWVGGLSVAVLAVLGASLILIGFSGLAKSLIADLEPGARGASGRAGEPRGSGR